MTTTHKDNEKLLDRAILEVASSEPLRSEEDAAIEKVRVRLTNATEIATDGPLENCADYQRLIPALVADNLPEARALLVQDHTRECISCRRALLEQRTGQSTSAQSVARPIRRRIPAAFRLAAAALIVFGLGTLGVLGGLDYSADKALRAQVADIDGSLQLVTPSGLQALSEGSEFRSHQAIRTAKGSGAMINLADGSIIELADRSEVRLSASRRGTTIDLDRGNVIVHAAPQGSGRLYLSTDQCQVAVKGTIFSVAHGIKGSRVSVIEGAVEVNYSGYETLLHPGEQVSTSIRLASVPVEEEIAWSRNADEHRALLAELSQLQREISHAVQASTTERTSTRLLNLTLPNTVMYMSLPDVTEGLTTAHEVFETRLASSDALRTWWDEEVVAKGHEAEIDAFFDHLSPFADALGDEVVVTLPSEVFTGNGGPIVMADLADADAFRELLEAELERIAGEGGEDIPIQLIDDPWVPVSVQNQYLLWISDDLLIAAPTLEQIQAVAAMMAGSASSDFSDTVLYAGLNSAYGRGVAWLFGLDLTTVWDTVLDESKEQDLELLERLGVLDATTLVAERSYDGENVTLQATLDFNGPRRGIASWLAEPAPMGSLQFISSEANLVAAVAAKDAADMFDELIEAVGSLDGGITTELEKLRDEYGIDFRNDLAATFGGEAAFAIDGPLVPTPSWKLIAEVYDPATLQATITHSVDEINQLLDAEGKENLVLESTTAGGRVFSALSRPGVPTEVHWTIVDGFLVAGPSRAMIERAIQHRNSGANLPNSATFLNLLPRNGFTDFSALVYRNLGDVTDALAVLPLQGAFGEKLDNFDLDLLAAPSLYCVWGETNRITVGGTGPDLLAIAPLAAFGSLFEMDCDDTPAETVVEQVSSLG
ncbi:MAG: hypothetical protein GY906_05100 [bacterium]|nr:hypothetical protein [bacterium]